MSKKNKSRSEIVLLIIDWVVKIATLLVAIYAINLSIKGGREANDQFNRSIQHSDSIFSIQLENERILNDSLTSEIKKLQKITNTQLVITENQMNYPGASPEVSNRVI